MVVPPHPGLRNAIEGRALGKLGQREIRGVAAGRVDLGVGVQTGSGVRPADLIDAVDTELRYFDDAFDFRIGRQIAGALGLHADDRFEKFRVHIAQPAAGGSGLRMTEPNVFARISLSPFFQRVPSKL
jgi:hypothetical protein